MPPDSSPRAYGFLEGLSQADIDHVLAVTRARRFDRGEALFLHGDRADAVYVIDRGRVAVRVVTLDGQTATLAVRGPGDIVGELALLSDETLRTATAVALEPTETMRIGRDDFAALQAGRPTVSDVLIRILATRLQQTSALLVEALLDPAPVRVCNRLAGLAELATERAGERAIDLSQEDLASLAGTTRALVNRVLQGERRAGRVRLARGRIIVLCEPDALRSAAREE